MNDPPEGLDTSALVEALADGWGLDVVAMAYAPVGFGSYHWRATGADGVRRFITVDDLEHKPWLGDIPDFAFSGMRRAFASARALRDHGLEFVLAPIPARDDETVHRIGARHSVAVFPFVDGQAGRRFEYNDSDERVAVLNLLTRLHAATAAVESIARTIALDVPGRAHIIAALQQLDSPWSGGPFSEPARRVLAGRASDVNELLGLFDRLAREVAGRGGHWVVTHGEPHAANFIETAAGRKLADWDTVALGPPERDLWMVLGDADDAGDEASRYADATGHHPDPLAMDLFRLMWDLSDTAAFIDVVRSPHVASEDTAKTFDGLTRAVASRDRWATLLA